MHTCTCERDVKRTACGLSIRIWRGLVVVEVVCLCVCIHTHAERDVKRTASGLSINDLEVVSSKSSVCVYTYTQTYTHADKDIKRHETYVCDVCTSYSHFHHDCFFLSLKKKLNV